MIKENDLGGSDARKMGDDPPKQRPSLTQLKKDHALYETTPVGSFSNFDDDADAMGGEFFHALYVGVTEDGYIEICQEEGNKLTLIYLTPGTMGMTIWYLQRARALLNAQIERNQAEETLEENELKHLRELLLEEKATNTRLEETNRRYVREKAKHGTIL